MTEMNEIWKDIPGFEGLYKVSNKGEVKSLNYLHTKKEKILKQFKNNKGYLKIGLCKEGKIKYILVHRLVCEAFLKNPYNLPDVNHRNENKQDNRLENLEYCDKRYNNNYGTRNERVAKAKKGIFNTKCSKAVKCLETGEIYPSISEVHRQLGFSTAYICECCNGKRNICGGYHWQYA